MKLVSIITVNYNHSYVTEELLQSIYDTNTYPSIEIIVVDNGSKVDPIPKWHATYPGIIFIRSPQNLGFAGGNNLGIANACGDYLFLVNNDTEFTANLVDSMVAFMEQNVRTGIASPKICYFNQPQILQYVGYTPMNYYTGRNTCIGQFQKDTGQYDQIDDNTAYAHGAAMIIRKDAVKKAGLIPENYFLYYEELDWCERIKQHGYKVSINTKAIIYHKESVSVGKNTFLKEYFMNRNRILFVRRNASPFVCFVFHCYFLAVVTPRNMLRYAKDKQLFFTKALLKAIHWNFTHSKSSTNLGFAVN